MAVRYDVTTKLLLIGDTSVGKTCLLLRFSNNSFSFLTMSTMGIDFKTKGIVVDGKNVKLQLWDTAGQERYHTLTSSFFRGADGVVLVYDITRRESFLSLRHWLDEIQLNTEVSMEKVLVGNKFDMAENRAVSSADGEALAKECDIPFFEASAKTAHNVEELFTKIVRNIIVRKSSSNAPAKEQLKPVVSLENKGDGSGKKEGCC